MYHHTHVHYSPGSPISISRFLSPPTPSLPSCIGVDVCFPVSLSHSVNTHPPAFVVEDPTPFPVELLSFRTQYIPLYLMLDITVFYTISPVDDVYTPSCWFPLRMCTLAASGSHRIPHYHLAALEFQQEPCQYLNGACGQSKKQRRPRTNGDRIMRTGAMVPIMEQRDVPFRLHPQQELPERSWSFRKFCAHDKCFAMSGVRSAVVERWVERQQKGSDTYQI